MIGSFRRHVGSTPSPPTNRPLAVLPTPTKACRQLLLYTSCQVVSQIEKLTKSDRKSIRKQPTSPTRTLTASLTPNLSTIRILSPYTASQARSRDLSESLTNLSLEKKVFPYLYSTPSTSTTATAPLVKGQSPPQFNSRLLPTPLPSTTRNDVVNRDEPTTDLGISKNPRRSTKPVADEGFPSLLQVVNPRKEG